MKFGGTSLGGAAAIENVVAVVRAQRERRPVVVVSAHAGITDALEQAALEATRGGGDDAIASIVARHRRILADLALDPAPIEPLLEELADLVRGVRLVGEASPKAVDALLSFGERLSARVVAAALCAAGVDATAVDAFTAGLLTDSSFGRARPLPDDGRLLRHLMRFPGVPVVTGFVGADERGNITTLGRNGSDFSAAWIGAAIGADEIQVWKDVDGVHTADPRLVPGARPIPRMSYAEVADLASFGSRVLHPAAMAPAMHKGVPMRVRNTLRPEAEGTAIDADAGGDRPAVRAIAHKADVALLAVRSRRLLPQHAFVARVFGELDAARSDVGPVAIGEAAVTVAVDAAHADAAAARLRQHGDVDVEGERAVVGVIGSPERLEGGGVAEVLATLAEAGVAVRCAGLGPRGSTFACALASDRLVDAVRALHARFLEA